MRQVNAEGLKLIKDFEGLELKAYQDVVGVWTIGYGHTGEDVYEGKEISAEEAEQLLLDDLVRFEAGVSRYVTQPITDNQFSALVSFTFNVGLGNFSTSTLLKKINSKDTVNLSDQFLRWNKAQGKVFPGLTRRRQAEKALFDKP